LDTFWIVDFAKKNFIELEVAMVSFEVSNDDDDDDDDEFLLNKEGPLLLPLFWRAFSSFILTSLPVRKPPNTSSILSLLYKQGPRFDSSHDRGSIPS
jgi:hypothetical protein